MNNLYTIERLAKSQTRNLCVCLVLLLLTTLSRVTFAQNGSPCYTPVVGSSTTVSGVQGGVLINLGGSFVNNISNLTDANTNNFATLTNTVGVVANSGVSVASTTVFPAGHHAGYVVEVPANLLNANLLQGIQIQTYLNGTLRESFTGANLLSATLVGGGSVGRLYISFPTGQTFNEIRLVSTGVLSVLNNLQIYYAVAFDPNCGTLDANNSCDDAISGVGTAVSVGGGLVTALGNLSNPGNLIDGDKSNYANLTTSALTSAILGNPYVGVKDLGTIYPAGHRAGFVVEAANGGLLDLSVLNGNVTIETYLHGQLQNQQAVTSSGGGLLGVSLLGTNNSGKQKLGVVTNKNFDEVRIVFNTAISASLSSLRIYYAFEEPASGCSDCNIALTTNSSAGAAYAGTLVSANLYGISLSSFSGTSNIVDAITTNFADLNLLVGLGTGARIRVKRTDGVDYPAGTVAGFAISSGNTLLNTSLLGANTIRLYRNGSNTPVQTIASGSVLNLGLLSGSSNITLVGGKSTVAFDEIELDIDAGLLALNTEFRIYYAYVQLDTDGDGVPDCIDTCSGSNNLDTDGDGIPNACDLDDDNDGILDTDEGTGDTDGDGIPNSLDLDSDNDGIPDLYESGIAAATIATLDANGDGVIDASVAKGTNGFANTLETAADSGTKNYVISNKDGDNAADFLDLDSDNDGILDIVESGYPGAVDANNDGVADGGDTDKDGIRDSVDGNTGSFGSAGVTSPRDTDSDGVADFRDLDSDNDGILDLVESGRNLTDADNNGVVDGTDTSDNDGIVGSADLAPTVYGSTGTPTPLDTDGDGVTNYRDLDSDNDGILDLVESGRPVTDADNNGVVDGTDPDGDGIVGNADLTNGFGSANTPAPLNTDGDGVPNYRDLDSDNDGILDLTESGRPLTDADNNGVVDGTDTDGDGIVGNADLAPALFGSAGTPTPLDTDGDTLPNYRDLDSDNDGILDLTESGRTLTDADSNGVVDGTDTDNDGIVGNADLTDGFGSANTPAPLNTDGDSMPNYRDLDSDNDSIFDLNESGRTLTDADSNGVVDGTDTDNDGIVGTADLAPAVYGSAGTPAVRNSDGDGVPDYRDLDSDNDGLSDLFEGGKPGLTDADNDGVVDGPDTDGDGIQNSADSNNAAFGSPGSPLPLDTDGDGTPNYNDLDSNGDGTFDIVTYGKGSLDVNKDGRIDNTTDADQDGIADVVDTKLGQFGGLPRPADLTPTLDIGSLTFLTGSPARDFVIRVYEIANVPTTGTVTLLVNKLPGFTIGFPTTSGTSNASSPVSNQNSNWTLTESEFFIRVTSKPGVVITKDQPAILGFTVIRNPGTTSRTQQNISVSILTGSGNEGPDSNNTVVTAITAN